MLATRLSSGGITVLGDDHLSVRVDVVNLEHRLRQIVTDERRRHRTTPVMKRSYPIRHVALPCPMRGDVHFIKVAVLRSS